VLLPPPVLVLVLVHKMLLVVVQGVALLVGSTGMLMMAAL
jgi:hypothetical protein